MKQRESLRHVSSWPDLPHVTVDDVPLQIPEYSAIYEDEKQNDGYSHDIVDMTSTYPPQTESPSTLIEDTAGEHQPDYNKGSPDADLVSVALGQAKLDGYSDEYAKHIAESARIVNNMWVNKRTRFASNVTTNGSVLSALIHMEGSQKGGKPRRRHGGNKVISSIQFHSIVGIEA